MSTRIAAPRATGLDPDRALTDKLSGSLQSNSDDSLDQQTDHPRQRQEQRLGFLRSSTMYVRRQYIVVDDVIDRKDWRAAKWVSGSR
jgi:hypothetical protein